MQTMNDATKKESNPDPKAELAKKVGGGESGPMKSDAPSPGPDGSAKKG